MEILDNITHLLGDSLKEAICPGAKLKIAASCFSIYAFEALKSELEQIESLEFIFTSPTFIPDEVTDKVRREKREFHIPKAEREREFFGSEFEIRLKNQLTQRAIAKECAEWMRRKAIFKSNRGKAPMQQFACVDAEAGDAVYLPLHGFTAVDLGYQKGDAVSNFVNKFDEPANTSTYLSLFEQVWKDKEQLEDVTAALCAHIASVYQDNSPERIYFLILYNIFSEFLEDINEDVLPNDLTGYQDTLIWKKLFSFQRDGATGIINKLETYNGCILADSVGLGKTFTALAVVKYYELRNKSVLVLCPKKLADNWLNYNRNLTTNLFAKDRFGYDVLCHTDLQRTRGESFGTPLNRINWGNYDLVVIDESHNFRNNDAYGEKETRYEKLMESVIKAGVKTKVLMLSATPVNNRFSDLRNQLALAYEGESENLSAKLRTEKDIDEIFRQAQAVFNAWSKLPPEERTATAILDALDFDFFELLDSVTIARSRKHIQTFYDFQSLLTLFSPVSKEKAIVLPKETGELDILIGTDCISEGQNLQDCDYLINYDIHWNPVRIIQRFGRIDRIGSKNSCIQLVNYWPDITLDEYINLKERVENRMVIADAVATGDDNPLNQESNDIAYRKEQLRRLQEEVIELEDLKTGVSITDLGLNDFRMDLLNYVKEKGDLSRLPNGMHAVIPSDPARGLRPGAIFALRNRNGAVNVNQHNRLHPYYLIYIGEDGNVIVDHTSVKPLLDLIRSACKDRGEPVPAAFHAFNRLTHDGRNMSAYSALLGDAIRSMIDMKEEKDIDSLFTGLKTSALVHTIKGLDDFELIAFLVIVS